MDTLRILRFWAACAWSDGELHPAEAAALDLDNATIERIEAE